MDISLYEELYRLDKTHWWFRGRRRVIFDVLDRTIPGHYQHALDVGCGSNPSAPLLRERAKQVTGLEMSDTAIHFAKKYIPDLPIIKGAWPNVHLPRQFDLITLFDVLEHIEDEARAIRKAEEMLLPGGVVFLTVPALPILWSEHDEHAHHRRRYTKMHLKNLIEQHTSLRIKRLTYFNAFLFPFIFSFRVIKRLLKIRSSSSDFFPIHSFLNHLFEFIFSAERYALRFIDFPVGVSLLCIAQKKSRHEK